MSLGYIGTFIAGFFYAYSFTAAISTSLLLLMSKNQNTLIACVVAASGAILGDVVIFLFVKHTVYNEVYDILHKKVLIKIIKRFPPVLSRYLIYGFCCLFVATPLPTEIGIGILASMTKISIKKFSVIAYLLNIIVLFLILSAGKLI